MMKIFLVCFLLFVSLVCGGGALRALEENENSVMTVPAGLAAIWADEEPETANWEERVGLEFSSWDGVAGTSIANFLKSGDFYRAPNSSEIFPRSELPHSGNSAVRGMRLRGLLVIPADGDLQLCVPAPEPEDLEDLGVPRVWLEACGLVQDGVPATPSLNYNYNQLGQQISIFDARGARTLTYDANHRLASETDPATGTAVALAYDSFGRVSQKTLLRGNESLAQFSRSYDASGRISSAGMDGTEIAAYGYLPGTSLLASQTLGNGVEKNVSYEQSRNLPTALTYSKDAVQIAGRAYAYNVLGQVTARVQTRGNAVSRNDAFGYNARGELVSATLGSAAYAYDFDAIGNRVSAEELAEETVYASNGLNQYLHMTAERTGEQGASSVFSPVFDADGNQTLIRTSTGTWHVVYNAESRPVRFENTATQSVVECGYDSQGRRFEKKVTVAGTVVLHERYAYDGYLQIAAFDVSTDASGTEGYALKRSVLWDPAEATAARPLAVKNVDENGNTALYYCTHDLTKNVCELLDGNGTVAATYDYAPFGAVTETVPADAVAPANPFQWSSEVYDSELDLVYYNYRHYSPSDGRWLSRDPIEEQGGENLYGVCVNDCISKIDILGRAMRDDWLWFPPHREETVAVSFTAIIEITQSGLDIVGLIPVLGEVADGINGVIYICRGDTINAALSIGAMVPVGGQGATVAKVGLKWKNAYDVVQQDINRMSKAERKKLVCECKKGGQLGPIYKTNKDAQIAAQKNGWRDTGRRDRFGNPIYTDGGNFYTKDLDGHKGGAWKVVDKNAEHRYGTVDKDLNIIGK